MLEHPIIYLAGSIRDGIAEDIAWRERAIDELQDCASVLSPLGGKSFDSATGTWTIFGDYASDAPYIVSHDFWAVDRADLIIFDLRSLSSKYPSIGTLIEYGRSTGRSIVRILVVDDSFRGHENLSMFPGLHPFLSNTAAKIFVDINAAISFTVALCKSWTTARGARYVYRG